MKAAIHPNYVEATVSCACGNTFTTRSTRTTLRTDLCNVCHPFYTGEQRIVDTAGQVERFMRRVETASSATRPSKRQQRLATRTAARDVQQRGDDAAAAEDSDNGTGTDSQATASGADLPAATVAETPTPVQPEAVATGIAGDTDERQPKAS